MPASAVGISAFFFAETTAHDLSFWPDVCLAEVRLIPVS
jgi:hypothetical protein